MVATPNLTLTITPPGGSPANYTKYMTYAGHQQQMSIAQNFGRQGDTATIPLTDEYAVTQNILIEVMSQVSLFDNGCGLSLFAGVVNDPILSVTGPNRNEWTLSCTDYTFYADNAIVHGVYDGWTVDAIVVDLVKQADCGITAAPVAAGGFVAPAPQLANFVLNYGSLSDAWRKLASLAGSVTPYGWYVDQNLALHFYDATTAQNSGVTFTTTPTVSGSTTQGHILLDSTNAYEWDGTSIHNRILVQGATQTVTSPTTGPATDTWRSDGIQSSWPLRYTISGTPSLMLGLTATSISVVDPGATPTTVWSVQQNNIGQYFLTTSSVPNAGTLISVWYDYEVPVVAQASDLQSIATYTGPNGGVLAEFISDSTLTTTPMALARAQQERTEYAFAAERATFNTSEDFVGWVRAGQVCIYQNQFIPDSGNGWVPGVDDQFLVIANQVTFGTGGYREAQITCVRL
jgi:hypothetical protein